MKRSTRLYLLFLVLIITVSALGQTNVAAPAIQVIPAMPGLSAYWDLVIAGISPFIVTGVAKIVPRLPKVFLPMMTPLVGILVGIALHKLGGASLTWYDMGRAGALAVFVREVFNQAVTKQLASSPPGNNTP